VAGEAGSVAHHGRKLAVAFDDLAEMGIVVAQQAVEPARRRARGLPSAPFHPFAVNAGGVVDTTGGRPSSDPCAERSTTSIGRCRD
jgi:hypothetical protein